MASHPSPDQLFKREKKVTPLDSRRVTQRRSERSNAFMQELRLRISSLLQTTLDAERIVGYFFQEVQSAVAVDGMVYRHDIAGIHFSQGTKGAHKASYQLNTTDDYFGEVEFTRRKRFTESELVKLESLLDLFVYPIRNAVRYQDALRSALTDPLTGVGNRLSLSNALKRELELCRRYDRELSILLLDIDRFKTVNDLFGHHVGDQVLKTVADITCQSLRDADSVYRLGGEEFLVLMSNTSLEDATNIGDRIRRNIVHCEIGPGSRPDITVSMGAAAYKAGMTTDTLIQAADKAMYKAKHNGRNQVQQAT
ncbi:MAG: GGDEF domain-containing protein [Natronospirillum sp.]|uniref:GGDEF domain-containing protein n=1 Tax=Natronospirillum sp. TaxID=2812955 RepID=UPI00260023F4|nr:GGDEF domain-containing protein [Natronospirillum sp.]MCH8553183.1 GGDEF domain-containing protein [Natronospirillum sp.]